MITIFAPAGIGEVVSGTDLAAVVETAVAADPAGPLTNGDIVVVTSKILSKAEGRSRVATSRESAITEESRHTVARRGSTRIVRTAHGLTLAAAGVDTSNVAPGEILLLPVDPDGSAARLLAGLVARTGRRLGVVVSDTAGRAWRIGQTDQAIGAAGLAVVLDYAGRTDAYGNELAVTQMAVADELAAAADLVKTKLAQRPVAVIRGLGSLLRTDGAGAADLVREPGADLFAFGAREAVLAAVLAVAGQSERYEELVALDPAERAAAVTTGPDWSPALLAWVTDLLAVDPASAVEGRARTTPGRSPQA